MTNERKFSEVPADLLETIGTNAGMLLTEFDISTGEYDPENIIGATSGGISFDDTPNFVDFADGIDNLPLNTMEMKHINNRTVKVSGTFVSLSGATAAYLAQGHAQTLGKKTQIVINQDVVGTDYKDIYFVTNYGISGGAIIIKLKNALSTGGFKLSTENNNKVKAAFEFTAHYSMDNLDDSPYEVYLVEGYGE